MVAAEAGWSALSLPLVPFVFFVLLSARIFFSREVFERRQGGATASSPAVGRWLRRRGGLRQRRLVFFVDKIPPRPTAGPACQRILRAEESAPKARNSAKTAPHPRSISKISEIPRPSPPVQRFPVSYVRNSSGPAFHYFRNSHRFTVSTVARCSFHYFRKPPNSGFPPMPCRKTRREDRPFRLIRLINKI